MIALDTNVLLYAHRSSFPRHPAALRALRDVVEGDRAFALPVSVIAEFVRVVTHPSLLRPPTPLEHAIAAVDSLVAEPNIQVLHPGDSFWDLLRHSLIEANATGNLVFDAQIVAVCREHGVDEILTEDRDFARFGAIRVRRLDAG